jgi:hypothetical protein
MNQSLSTSACVHSFDRSSASGARSTARDSYGRDFVDRDIEILNIKALGYEIARALADEMLRLPISSAAPRKRAITLRRTGAPSRAASCCSDLI